MCQKKSTVELFVKMFFVHSFVYFSFCFNIFQLFNNCTFVIKNLLDFDLCSNARSRKQITKYAKEKMREKQQQKQSFDSHSRFIFFFFFFFFERFKLFTRRFILTVEKQFAKQHNFVQYTHDMNNVDRNYDVSFSTQRFIKDIFSLKKSLRNQQLAFCKILQHENIEQNRK